MPSPFPNTATATTQVEMSQKVSEYQGRGLIKQTVYAVHSSRQKLESSIEDKSPKAQKDTLYEGENTKSGDDLPKSTLAHNLQALGNFSNTPHYEKNVSATSIVTTNQQRKVENSVNLDVKSSHQYISTAMETKKVALLTLEPTIGARKEKADED